MTDRPHGTRARYIGTRRLPGCRCARCKSANAKYEAVRLKSKLAGEWEGKVSVKRAQQHVIKLIEAGVSYRRTAALSGVAPRTVLSIRMGDYKYVLSSTVKKLMEVNSAMRPPKRQKSTGKWIRLNSALNQMFKSNVAS